MIGQRPLGVGRNRLNRKCDVRLMQGRVALKELEDEGGGDADGKGRE